MSLVHVRGQPYACRARTSGDAWQAYLGRWAAGALVLEIHGLRTADPWACVAWRHRPTDSRQDLWLSPEVELHLESYRTSDHTSQRA